MMTQLKLLTSMIDVYEEHLLVMDGDLNQEFWGTDLEVALNTQINNLIIKWGIATEKKVEDSLHKATLFEMIEYWKEWIEKVKWDINEKEVVSL